LTNQK